MARIIGPLHSDGASKQIGHSIIFKTKGNRSFATRYNKPGGVKKFTPSEGQNTMREHYAEALGKWQSLSDADKKQWDDFVPLKRGE